MPLACVGSRSGNVFGRSIRVMDGGLVRYAPGGLQIQRRNPAGLSVKGISPMSFKRRRSARLDPARLRVGSNLETLESRQLLTQSPYLPVNDYPLSEFPAATSPGRVPGAYIAHPIGSSQATLNSLGNSGKYLTGEDRQGNRWEITVTGPGYAVVNDTTPADGILDDDLNTITLVGTDPNKTVVTGQVEQSTRTVSNYQQLNTLGTVQFNRLEANHGVKSIVLNGFLLTDTIDPVGDTLAQSGETALNATTGIFLHGGVGLLAFEGIDARFPLSDNPQPIVVAIGDPTTPLKVHPNIRIDHIYNTSYDDTAFLTGGSGTIPTGPLTSPTVTLFVNGTLASFDVVSVTQEPDLGTLSPAINSSFFSLPVQLIPTQSASLEYQFPTVGTTGRTAVQAAAIDHIRASGGLTNTTFSKGAQPFQNSLTALNHVGAVTVGGPTDALAIDSRGSIKSIKLAKGLGNPVGINANPIYYGTPASENGYAASGFVGGEIVTEGNIGSLEVAPANTFKQYAGDPQQLTSALNEYSSFAVRPGSALTTSVIAAGGSIGSTHIVGDLTNSEIKSGYNYYSGLGGADGSLGKSSVGPVAIRGNLLNSVVSASFRPVNANYNGGTAGDGTITGSYAGSIYQTSTGITALGNKGSGFYSRFNNAHPRPTTPKK